MSNVILLAMLVVVVIATCLSRRGQMSSFIKTHAGMPYGALTCRCASSAFATANDVLAVSTAFWSSK